MRSERYENAIPIAIRIASPCTSGTGISDGAQPSAISTSPAARHARVQPNDRALRRRTRDRQRLLADEHQPDRERRPPTRRVDRRRHDDRLRRDPRVQPKPTRAIGPTTRRVAIVRSWPPTRIDGISQIGVRRDQMDLAQRQDRDRGQRPHEQHRGEMHPPCISPDARPPQPPKHHRKPSAQPRNGPLTALSHSPITARTTARPNPLHLRRPDPLLSTPAGVAGRACLASATAVGQDEPGLLGTGRELNGPVRVHRP